MKSFPKFLMAGVLALAMAGCSNSGAADTKPADETKQEEKIDAKEPAANTTNTADFTQGDALKTAFENKGYQISDLETKNDESSFDATGDYGLVEVDVEKGNAKSEYQAAQNENSNEDYLPENSYGEGDRQLTVFFNQMNAMYNIAALDTESDVSYEAEGIAESDLQNVLDVFASVGFPVE